MKHIFSQKSLLSSSIKSSAVMASQQQVSSVTLRQPALQLVKYAGMAVFFAVSLSLSACGDKEAATQTAPSSSNEAVATSNDTVADSTSIDKGAAVSEADADKVESSQEAVQAELTETAEVAAPEPELAAGAGKEVYESRCKQCHEGGLLGAPKFGDKAAWAPRIEQGKEALYTHSAKGYKKMPAQVNGDVSVAQVHAAVDYMVEHSS